MKNLKIFSLIQFFSQEEKKEFEYFTKSKFSSKRDESQLARFVTKFSIKKYGNYSREKIIRILSRKFNLKESVVKVRLSELTKLAEYYIVLNSSKNSSVEKYFLLLAYFYKTRDFKLYDKTFHKLENILTRQKFGFNLFINLARMYQSGSEKNYHAGNIDLYLEMSDKKSKYNIAHLISDYLVSMISYFQNKTYHGSASTPYTLLENKFNFTEFIRSMKQCDERSYCILFSLFYLYKAFKQSRNGERVYSAARKFIDMNRGYFETGINNFLYYTLINYCVNMVNYNESRYCKEIFELSNEMIKANGKDESFYKDFMVFNFTDCVFAGLKLKKFSWVNQFIERCGKYLPDSIKADNLHHAKSMVLIHRHKYAEALNELERVNRKNYQSYIESGMFKIRCYFYLKEYESAHDELERLLSYITYHDEIPDTHSKIYKAYSSDLKKLLQFKSGNIDLKSVNYYFSKRKSPKVLNWITEAIN